MYALVHKIDEEVRSGMLKLLVKLTKSSISVAIGVRT